MRIIRKPIKHGDEWIWWITCNCDHIFMIDKMQYKGLEEIRCPHCHLKGHWDLSHPDFEAPTE